MTPEPQRGVFLQTALAYAVLERLRKLPCEHGNASVCVAFEQALGNEVSILPPSAGNVAEPPQEGEQIPLQMPPEMLNRPLPNTPKPEGK
jgi:hypothetical protein